MTVGTSDFCEGRRQEKVSYFKLRVSYIVLFRRRDLLDIVRKHSVGLLRTSSQDGDESNDYRLRDDNADVMDGSYWREIADLYFVRGVDAKDTAEQAGPLSEVLFFVRGASQVGNQMFCTGGQTGFSDSHVSTTWIGIVA